MGQSSLEENLMEKGSSDLLKQGASMAENGLGKVSGVIRDGERNAKDAASTMGDKVDNLRTMARQGIDTVKQSVQQTRDSVSESSEAVISYTQENPIKALMIAAVSGALVWTLLKAFAASRD